MIIAPITIEGFDGLNLDGHEPERFRQAVLAADSPSEGPRLVGLLDVLRRYNTLRPRLLAEKIARQERDKAMQLVETRYAALSTEANWLAAHHAYVVAVDDARIAIDMWQERATAAADIPFIWDSPSSKAGYQQILDEGHPEVEPLTGNPALTAEQLQADLQQAYDYRRPLIAETLPMALAQQDDANLPSCIRCRRAFDPTGERPGGAARFSLTDYCRSCWPNR